MEKIGKKELEEAKALPPVEDSSVIITPISEKDIEIAIMDMAKPVEAQKRLAVQIKYFLDMRMADDMKKKGFLSDHTRRWCDLYNNVLEKIQRALYGDKTINMQLDMTKLSHSQLAIKIRNSQPLQPLLEYKYHDEKKEEDEEDVEEN